MIYSIQLDVHLQCHVCVVLLLGSPDLGCDWIVKAQLEEALEAAPLARLTNDQILSCNTERDISNLLDDGILPGILLWNLMRNARLVSRNLVVDDMVMDSLRR